MNDKTSTQGEFTGRHMLMIMVAFFGVIITVNLTMAILASTSWTGLVVPNTYVASQKFNGVLEQSRKQAALGWGGELSGSGQKVTFELHKADGSEVAIDKVSVIFRRPATETLDHLVQLDLVPGGDFVGSVNLGEGIWTAEVLAEIRGEQRWKMIYNIKVNKDGSFKPVINVNKIAK